MHTVKNGGLRNLNNNLAPCMPGQNLFVSDEYIVELMHRINDGFGLVCMKELVD